MKDAILKLWRTRRITVLASGAVLVVVIAAVVAIALSGGDDKKKTTSTTKPATTTVPPKPGRRAPLTGVIDKSGKSFTRPAVTVKINNTATA